MKICYIAASGYEGYFPRLISHFSQKYDVYLITYDKCTLKNVKAFRLNNHENYRPLNKLLMPCHLIKIRKLLKKIDPDVIHGHYLTSYGVYAALSGFHPVINSTSGSDVLLDVYTTILPSQKLYFFSKILLKTVLKNSDLIIAVSARIRRMLIHFGFPSDKIAVVPPGVDTNIFSKYPFKPSDLLKSLGIHEGDRVIISTRAFWPIYNVECLIKALSIIVKEVPNVKAILLGRGSLRPRLEKMAKQLDLESHINFVGAVSHKEVPRYLNLADVYVSTSLSNGTASSLLEAMACQLPLVVSDTEANKELIKDGENGLLFERKKFRDLANKVLLVLENKQLRERLAQNRQIIYRKVAWEENMRTVEKLYSDFVN